MIVVDKLARPLKRKTYDVIVWWVVSLILRIGKKRVERNFNIQSNNMSVLFNTQYHWYHSWLDYTLAAALKYRGFDVKMMVCDGLPYCEQQTLTVKRPSCKQCFKNTEKRAKLFEINIVKVSDHSTTNDIDEFSKISQNKDLGYLREFKYKNVNIGNIAFRNFTHFYKGVREIGPEQELVFRKCIHSALILCEATSKLFQINEFDKVIT